MEREERLISSASSSGILFRRHSPWMRDTQVFVIQNCKKDLDFKKGRREAAENEKIFLFSL